MAQPNELQKLLSSEPVPSQPTELATLIGTQGAGSDALRLKQGGTAAMIAGEPTKPEFIHINAMQPDPRASVDAATQEFLAKQRDLINQTITAVLDTEPTKLTVAVQQGIEANKRVDDLQRDPISQELAYVKQAAPQSQDESLQREYALRVAANNRVAELLDEQGTWDTVTDIAGMFVPFGTAKDIGDLEEELSKDAQLSKLAASNIEGIVTRWQSLPVGEREALLDPLLDAIKRATSTSVLGWGSDGNALKTVELFKAFFSPDAASEAGMIRNVDVALGALDVVPGGVIKDLAKLSKVEKLNMVKAMDKAADMMHRENNAAKVAAGLGDTDSAATLTTAAMQSEEVARSMGMTQHTASLNAFPHQTQEWMREVTDGIAPEISKQLNRVVREAEGYARSISDESDLLQLGALKASDRKARIESFFEKMNGVSEDYLNEGIYLENLTITKQDKSGFTYRYTLRNQLDATEAAEGGKPRYKIRTGEVKWGIDDVTGTYSETANAASAQSLFSTRTLSPAAWSTGDFNKAVKTAIVASDLTAANTEKVGRMMQWALDPVKGLANTKARGRIEAVLEAGDEFINKGTGVRGRVFTPEELAAGVDTPTGTVKLLAPNEVEAYYRTRLLADTFYQTQNQLVRRELELGKFQTVLLRGATERQIGKPYETVESASLSVRDKFGYKAWDESGTNTVELSAEQVAKQYEEGNVLVRLRHDWNSSGNGNLARDGEYVEYAFVSRDKLRDLPEQVLEYKHGYVPKINKAEFFVALRLPINKAGVQGAVKTQALRAFNSKADAEAFRQAQIAKFIEKHPEVSKEQADTIFQLGDANELNAINRLEEAVSSGNGLFTGTRSSDDIVFGLTGQRLERVSALQAFQRNVQHLGKNLTRNELRIGEEKRWLNTVRQELPDVQVRGFGTTRLPDTPKGRALEEMRRVISEWNAIPEQDETLFTGMIQYAHDWMLAGGRRLGLRNKDSIHSLLWLKHFSPFQAMKAANLHVMLGALNPAQIYVQASAAAVAMARNSAFHLSKSGLPFSDVAHAFRFSMLDNIQNEAALGKVLKIMERSGDLEPEVSAAYMAYRKSGLYESVFNNADTAYMQGTGFGASMKVMSKASNVSLMFYRSGEMFNRRYSFIKAFAKHLSEGGKLTPDDDALELIIQNANESMLELNQANRAWWQGGAGTGTTRQVLGMSTQFLQVMGKTMELAMKGTGRGGWTNAEKARVLAGQVLLFGAAGVPLFNAAPGAVINWLGLEPNDETTTVINQGIIGAVVGNMFDGDLDVANRAALGGQVLATLRDLFLSEEPFVVKAMGVTGESGSRFFQALSEIAPLIQGNFASNEDLTLGQLKAAAAAIAEVPTTGRNLLKAYIMHNTGRIYDRRGRAVTEDNFTFATELGTALGFRPSEETRIRMLQLDNNDFEDMAQEAAEIRINMLHKWVKISNLDPEYGKVVTNAIQLMDEGIDNEQLTKRINEIVEQRIWNEGDTLEARELERFIKRSAVDHLIDGYVIDRGLMDGRSELGVLKPLRDKMKEER